MASCSCSVSRPARPLNRWPLGVNRWPLGVNRCPLGVNRCPPQAPNAPPSAVAGAGSGGGTADADGNIHEAEKQFERFYGPDVATWFHSYTDHSLLAYVEKLTAIAAGQSVDQRGWLDDHPQAGPLTRLIASFDRAQLAFHRAHLQLAVVQLTRVGVEVGTGGTSYKDYLARYEAELAPLFPKLHPKGMVEAE